MHKEAPIHKDGRIANQGERKICGVLFGDPAQAQQSGLCGERTSDGMYELSRPSGSEGIVVREDEAGFGEGTPQQDHRKGENEREANFGTVVESCSNYFRYPLNGDFCDTPYSTTDKICEKLDTPSHYNGHFFGKKQGSEMLNFDELHLLGIKCFHLFGISESKNQRAE